MPHYELQRLQPGGPELEDYLRQLEELMRTMMFGMDAPPYSESDTPLFTPGSVIFAGSSGALAEDNENLFYTAATNLLNTRNLQILGGEDGSIWYTWDGKLTELKHGSYGQILVTGGHGERPFWDWGWEAPGLEGSPSVVIYLMVESSFSAVRIKEKDWDHVCSIDTSGDLTTFIASNLGDEPLSVIEDYDPTLDTSVAAAKVSMDYDEGVDVSGDLTIEIITGVA